VSFAGDDDIIHVSDQQFCYVRVACQDSTVSIASGYGSPTEGSVFEFWQGQEFSLLRVVRASLGPTSLIGSENWGGTLSSRVKLTTHLQLVPRSRKFQYIHSFSYISLMV
jgi:hypothetical protein